MANTKEIKNRIRSVQDTQKITNAMYMISSNKMRKAKRELDKTRPYFEALRLEIKRIFRTAENDIDSRYFYPADGSPAPNRTHALLVVTADKGLAGAYNKNVIEAALKHMEEHSDVKLFVVGEYGRQYFAHHHIPIEQSFLYTAQNPTMSRARTITSTLLSLFEKGEVDKVYMLYTDMETELLSEAKEFRLVPFHRASFYSTEEEKQRNTRYIFEPNVEAVLENTVKSYVSGFIYSALIDSFCAEQNARMTAMSSANDNAQKLLDELSLEYNRVRQAAITREITEVSSGAKAQKRKRLKEESEE